MLGALGAAAVWAPLPSFTGASESARATSARSVPLGPLSLEVPAAWAPAPMSAARVPDLSEPVAVFTPVPGLSAYAVVALDERGVPPALTALVGPLGRGRATTLAGASARTYGPYPVAGDRSAQLTVARTSAGTLTVACLAPSAAWTGVVGCADQVLAGGPAPEPGI